MASKPTPGGSSGSWGTELNEFLDVSLAADGKVLDGAEQSTSAAPTADAQLTNKKYVDEATANKGTTKAWVVFDGTSVDGVEDLTGVGDSFNVTSVVDNGTGLYTINWDNDFASGNYAISGIAIAPSGTSSMAVSVAFGTTPSAGSVSVQVQNDAGTKLDSTYISLTAIGDLA